jgi:hypothetical protein
MLKTASNLSVGAVTSLGLASSSTTTGVYSSTPIPLSKSDSRVLVDIGISSNDSKNLWTSLPSGWAYTSSTGSSVNTTTGYTPGSGNNQTGKILSPSNFNATNGTQGTIYTRVSKAALSVDSTKSGTTAWYNSTGNALGQYGPGYPPCLWCIQSNATTRFVSLMMNPTAIYFQDFNGGPAGDINVVLLNTPITSINTDSTYWDVVFTWSGSTYYFYIDGELIKTGTLTNGAFAADQLYYVTVGNGPTGPSAYLGGNLGPFAIQRFQINTAYCPPIAAPITIGIHGDSYCAGSGVNGDGGIPSVATIASINAANSLQNIASATNGGSGVQGQVQWAGLLQSYAFKQFGIIPSLFGACKSGYSGYWTGGYGTPIDNPAAATPLTVYSDALNAALPSVVIYWDSVNNQIQCPNGTGTGVDPVGDIKWKLDYWAANNPNLRSIILVEAMSLELCSQSALTGAGSVRTPAEVKALTASWRASLRAYYGGTTLYLAGGRVPVTYVTTYEQMAGASDGTYMLWGTHPSNTITSGGQQGPNGSSPDIHLCPYGRYRIADIVWTVLKPILNSLLPLPDVGNPYNGGTLSTITPNCAQSMEQIYTVSGNATINAPINAPNIGARLTITIIKSTASAVTLTWNGAYRNMPTWSTGSANTRATADLRYDGSGWQFIGGSTGFA